MNSLRSLPLRAAALLTFGIAAHADVVFGDFSSTAGLNLVGSTASVNNRLRLTPAAGNQAGGAWFQTRQDVSSPFVTTFEFALSAAGDGFAFVIQNGSASALGGAGCELGYHGLANSVAVEFDSFSNASCAPGAVGDPGSLHVGVHTQGTGPNSVLESASLGTVNTTNFANGALHTARVEYTTGTLRVFLDDLVLPILQVAVNLDATLNLTGGAAYVGFTAATGGSVATHEIASWGFFENAGTGMGNSSPATPVINEPGVDGQVLNPADVHMQTTPFSDPDAGDAHLCTDWEIWTLTPTERVWSALCITGLASIHTHLGDGSFEGSQAGRTELVPSRSYFLRARHRDDSGDSATDWSNWTVRFFDTGASSAFFPYEIEDVDDDPAPRWDDTSTGAEIVIPGGAVPSQLRLESETGDLLLSYEGVDGVTQIVTNPAALPQHVETRIIVTAGSTGLSLPETDLALVDQHCELTTVLLPPVSLSPGQNVHLWIASDGSTFYGTAQQTAPDFTNPARVREVPWVAAQSGYEIDVFATGFQLPVNIAFVPDPGPGPNDPFFYVTELYGTIKVVTRSGSVGVYATNLLNFNPTGAFPGSGEQGLSGIVVDPISGDVFAAMLYNSPVFNGVHYPKVVRFTSLDGGMTAASMSTILDMVGEAQGQSHQISNLELMPDGRLLVHMGDGFVSSTAQNLNSYRGKILRMELDGSPATDNPFYDATNITARDYVYAYGVRNPFGGSWRAADGAQWLVENGPSVDRFTKIVPGRNYLWNDTDSSMLNFAAYSWSPARGPVNLAWIQPETFGGSGFPAEKMGHAFVTESGPTWATGPQSRGKKIREFVFDANGDLVGGPDLFIEYVGTGKATAVGLAAGPDGLYFTDLYKDQNPSSPIEAGANVLRIRFGTVTDCNDNGVLDACDIADGASFDGNGDGVPDECQCASAQYCASQNNSTGSAATLAVTGSLSVFQNDTTLVASDCPTNVSGIFYYGSTAGQIPFGDGFRCAFGNIFRLPTLTSNGSGVATFDLDVTTPLQPAGQITSGSTWHFQFWFRDPQGPGGSGFNLTDGQRITFCP